VASFTPSPADDNTFVICRAVNKYFPQEALEDQWKISVLYPPLPKVNYEHPSAQVASLQGQLPANIIAQEADRVVLSCRSESNPRPYEYHWRHNGASRALPESGGLLAAGLSSSQLVLASVGRADSGNYSCLAENSQAVLPK
jgi:hypothetical protein